MEFVDGGVILTPEELDAIPTLDESTGLLTCPTSYSSPSYRGLVPGADWFIEGRRYREVGRSGDRTHLRLIEES